MNGLDPKNICHKWAKATRQFPEHERVGRGAGLGRGLGVEVGLGDPLGVGRVGVGDGWLFVQFRAAENVVGTIARCNKYHGVG